MRAPFLVRLHGPDASRVAQVAADLAERLACAGMQVDLDGRRLGEGRIAAAIEAGHRDTPDEILVNVGLRDAAGEPQWVRPFTVALQPPERAAAEILAFLVSWGFAPRPPAAAPAP